jgi:hypothetical protein
MCGDRLLHSSSDSSALLILLFAVALGKQGFLLDREVLTY